jgi:predicted glycoside hydrolase/deacetylase ChbG (UPF0249 family)
MPAWLVVNADDLGVSEGANAGILRAHREGIVTSASLAVTTPHYEHALHTCVRACPELGVGLHFTLTSGTSVSKPSDVPTLVGADGMFRLRFTNLLATAAREPQLLREIELELEAQLARLADDGIAPDHIDGERHVHLIPGIFEIVVAAAQRHGIRFVRVGSDLGARYFRFAQTLPVMRSGGFIKAGLLTSLSNRAREKMPARVSSPDHVASYVHTGRIDLVLPELLRGAVITGITEVMVHPGIPEANRHLALGNRELEAYLMSEDRRAEMNACIKLRGATGAWELTNYRTLAVA